MNSVPSKVRTVCVGPAAQSQLNLHWDLLPCHLQNGSDITGYIIQYSLTSGGEAQNVSSRDSRLHCRQEPGVHHGCTISSSLLLDHQTYNFQVAARNRYGVGPFSSPITAMLNQQGMQYGYYVKLAAKSIL